MHEIIPESFREKFFPHVLLFCLLSPCFLYAEKIVDIKVEGTERVAKSVVISVSGLEAGQELKTQVHLKDATRNAVEQLYDSKLFKDVKIQGEEVSDGQVHLGVVLTIEVKEWPIISKVSFKGNKKIKTKELKEKCKLNEFEIGSESAIFDAKVRIRKAYEEKGYYLVNVTPVTEEGGSTSGIGEGKIKIKYVIEEGKRVKIKNINIKGNKGFSDKKLKSKIKNHAKSFWPWSGKLNAEELEQDPTRILEFYQSNGYPNCKVMGTDIVPDKTKEWVEIVIEVEEGRKFFIGEVSFQGNEFLDEKRLRENLRFKKKDVYSRDKLNTTLQEIYGVYSDYGYLYANIDAKENVTGSPETGSPERDSIVDIVYEIKENNPARVHKIEITDNLKTYEKVIRRELTIYPGEIFSRKKLITSQRKVFTLGFFKNLSLDTKRANEKGDIDLIIKVEEKAAGQASAGASFYPQYGLVGNLILSTPNFRGLGENVSIKLEKGASLQNVEFGYSLPWIFDRPIGVGFNLFNTTESRTWYDLKKIGGNVSIGAPVPRLIFTKWTTSYGLENVEVTGDTAKLSRWVTKGLRSTVGFSLYRDSRDNYINPTTGTRSSLGLAFTGGILQGDVNCHKEIFEISTWHKLIGRFVLGWRGKFGFVNGYEKNEQVPLDERFVLGGIGSWGLRGYPDWTVGPRDSANEIIGGRFASLFSVEGKIAFDENIYPLVFFDIGQAWENFEHANFQGLKRSVGVGFRVEIPMMGLLGFDLGYGIDKEPRGWEFHLQMGGGF